MQWPATRLGVTLSRVSPEVHTYPHASAPTHTYARTHACAAHTQPTYTRHIQAHTTTRTTIARYPRSLSINITYSLTHAPTHAHTHSAYFCLDIICRWCVAHGAMSALGSRYCDLFGACLLSPQYYVAHQRRSRTHLVDRIAHCVRSLTQRGYRGKPLGIPTVPFVITVVLFAYAKSLYHDSTQH